MDGLLLTNPNSWERHEETFDGDNVLSLEYFHRQTGQHISVNNRVNEAGVVIGARVKRSSLARSTEVQIDNDASPMIVRNTESFRRINLNTLENIDNFSCHFLTVRQTDPSVVELILTAVYRTILWEAW